MVNHLDPLPEGQTAGPFQLREEQDEHVCSSPDPSQASGWAFWEFFYEKTI